MACDASFLKHYHTPVIHFGTLHFKNEEFTVFYSVGPISRYSHNLYVTKSCDIKVCHPTKIVDLLDVSTYRMTLL